jgi:Enoyl-CoA hydratase/carnithine racemase
MKYETIKYKVESNILTLTLNRPEKLNAFTGQMMDDFLSAFAAAGRDAAVRVIIVKKDRRGFCAGADLS